MTPQETIAAAIAASHTSTIPSSPWLGPALFTLCGALLAAYLAHRKLSLDLFDKRYEVYIAIPSDTMDRLAEITKTDFISGRSPDVPNLRAFLSTGRKARVLFGPEVAHAVTKIEKTLQSVAANVAELQAIRARNDGRSRVIENQATYSELLTALFDQTNEFVRLAHPYLRQYWAWRDWKWNIQQRWASSRTFRPRLINTFRKLRLTK